MGNGQSKEEKRTGEDAPKLSATASASNLQAQNASAFEEQQKLLQAKRSSTARSTDDTIYKFSGKYLGSCSISACNNDACVQAVERVKSMKNAIKSVLISASAQAIQVNSMESMESISNVPVDNVVFVYADQSDKRLFAYISADKMTRLLMCHVFALKDNSRAIAETVAKLMIVPYDSKAASSSGANNMTSTVEAGPSSPEEMPMQIFKATYIGKAPVQTPFPHSQVDVQRGLAHIKNHLPDHPTKIFFTVTATGLQMLDRATNMIIHSAKLSEVSYCAIDEGNKKIVALILHDPDLSVHCHALLVKSRATDITQTIGAAFAIAAEQRRKLDQAKRAAMLANPRAGPQQAFSDSLHPPELPKTPERSPKMQKALVGRTESSATATEPAMPRLSSTADVIGQAEVKTQINITPDAPQTQQQQQAGGAALGVYDGLLLGSVPSVEAKGQAAALESSIQIASSNKEPISVVIMVSIEGLKVIDPLTSEVLATTPIKCLSFVTNIVTDKEFNKAVKKRGGKSKFDETLFVCISTDERVNAATVDVYKCARARDVCETINVAFQVALEQQKKRKGNPFMPIDDVRERVNGPLFTRQIHRRDITPMNVIGMGQFGEVYMARQQVRKGTGDSGSDFCLRAVKLMRAAATADDKKEFLRECETMLDLDHANLVRLIGVAVQQRPWLCVLEYMRFGDVRGVLRACKNKHMELKPLEQLKLAVQIAAGMAYLSANRYVHMDLAARNCLLRSNSVVKIADFGLTRRYSEGKSRFKLDKTLKLPIKWMAIETMDERLFSQASDVWSFGVTVWEILSYGAMPYEAIKNTDVQTAVRDGTRLEKPESCSPEMYALMHKCWLTNPKLRPTFVELRNTMVQMAKEILAKDPSQRVRDIGASLAKAGAESIFMTTLPSADPDFDDHVQAESMFVEC